MGGIVVWSLGTPDVRGSRGVPLRGTVTIGKGCPRGRQLNGSLTSMVTPPADVRCPPTADGG